MDTPSQPDVTNGPVLMARSSCFDAPAGVWGSRGGASAPPGPRCWYAGLSGPVMGGFPVKR